MNGYKDVEPLLLNYLYTLAAAGGTDKQCMRCWIEFTHGGGLVEG